MDRKDAIVTGRVTRERACDGKLRLRTPDYAEKLAKRMSKQHGAEQSYYFCEWCHCYHLFRVEKHQ